MRIGISTDVSIDDACGQTRFIPESPYRTGGGPQLISSARFPVATFPPSPAPTRHASRRIDQPKES
jgi:hypothetical protein